MKINKEQQTNIQFNYLMLDIFVFGALCFAAAAAAAAYYIKSIFWMWVCVQIFNGITRESIKRISNKLNNNTNYSVVIISISACCSFLCIPHLPLLLSFSFFYPLFCVHRVHNTQIRDKKRNPVLFFILVYGLTFFEMFKWINSYKANK